MSVQIQPPLREATTRIIYYRLRDNIRNTPNCYDAWRQHHSASSLTDSSWKLLWKIPIDCAVNPFQRDCLWKQMHSVLPTQDKRLPCHLTASDICPASGMCRDSLQHAFNSCAERRSHGCSPDYLRQLVHISISKNGHHPTRLYEKRQEGSRKLEADQPFQCGLQDCFQGFGQSFENSAGFYHLSRSNLHDTRTIN